MLQQLKGYDSYNTLLLPPRDPGEKLPQEVYDYFKEVKKSKEEHTKAKHVETQENGESPTRSHRSVSLELALPRDQPAPASVGIVPARYQVPAISCLRPLQNGSPWSLC